MLSWQARLLNVVGKTVLKPLLKRRDIDALDDSEILEMQRRMEKFAKRAKIPRKADIVEENINGVPCDWVNWGASKPVEAALHKIIIYYHGSGFLVLSPKSYRQFTWRLAKQSGCTVLAPGYRKAPYHQHPAALDDAYTVYQELLERGYLPENIIVSGDSAGGNLTLASLLRIRDNNLPQPAGAFCVSPWTNLTARGSTMITNAKKDPLFAVTDTEDMVKVARIYAPDVDLTHPYISPAYGDFTGLAPLLIYAGSTEILLNDAHRVVEKAKKAGVSVEFRAWRHMPHSFHVLAGFLPEGKKAIRKISEFVHLKFAEAAEQSLDNKAQQGSG